MERVHPGHRGSRVMALLLGMLLTGFAFVSAREAVTTELVVADRFAGVALYGFDPVAYFVDRMARPGKASFELSFAGLTWRFHSEGNRAAFIARPAIYVPRFGGYDPVALIRGAPVPGHPALFVVYDGRLFLFHRPDSRAAFLAEPDTMIKAAGSAWPKVMRTLVP